MHLHDPNNSQRRIVEEHVAAVDEDGMTLWVDVFADDHGEHIARHEEFLDSEELNTQQRSRLRRHIRQHAVALNEANRLGISLRQSLEDAMPDDPMFMP